MDTMIYTLRKGLFRRCLESSSESQDQIKVVASLLDKAASNFKATLVQQQIKNFKIEPLAMNSIWFELLEDTFYALNEAKSHWIHAQINLEPLFPAMV